MVEFKIVIGTKSGKCHQKEIKEPEAKVFVGKKIGDSLKGDDIGMPGYEFSITGGSDFCGFPMRKDVSGSGRKKVLSVKAVGMKKLAKGVRQRKTVCGNTINQNITQVNLKVLKEGAQKLGEEGKGEEKPEEKKEEEKPAEKKEEKKQAPKEEKKEEKKESPKENPKEEKKEPPKEEKKPEAK